MKGNSTDYYVYTKDENIGKQYGTLHVNGGNINNQNSKIDTGAGSDFVQIHGEINNQFGKVDLGEGDDGFRYEPTNWNAGNENAIDGGKGFDTLYLKGNSPPSICATKILFKLPTIAPAKASTLSP